MSKKIPLEYYKDKTNLRVIGEEGRYLIVEDEYGKMKIFKPHLLKGVVPSIRTAINPQEYCINQLKKVHKDKYDYSLVEYVNDRFKIKIICKEHGEFEQVVNKHKMGGGCQECGNLVKGVSFYCSTNAIRNKEDWCDTESGVYIIELYNKKERFLKIGISKDIVRRVRQIKCESKYNIKILSYEKMELYSAVMMEEKLLKDICNIKYKPKNKFTGETECIIKFEYSNLLKENFLKRMYINEF